MSTPDQLIENTLSSIVKNKVGQKPKWEFKLENAGQWALIIFGLALAVFVISFILWDIFKAMEVLEPSEFGDFAQVIAVVPLWVWLASVLLFLGALYLLYKFTRLYKNSLAVVASILFAVLGLAAAASALTSVHPTLRAWSQQTSTPFVGNFYDKAKPKLKRVMSGEVVSATAEKIIMDVDEANGAESAEREMEFLFAPKFMFPEKWPPLVGERAAVILDNQLREVVKFKPLDGLGDEAFFPKPLFKVIKTKHVK